MEFVKLEESNRFYAHGNVGFDEVMRSLEPDAIHECFRSDWEASQASFPESLQGIAFLQEEFISQLQPLLRLPEAALHAVQAACCLIRRHAGLTRLVWHWHYQLANNKFEMKKGLQHLPHLKTAMGNLSGMLPAVLFISVIPYTIELYRKLGIPQHILIATLGDLNLWMHHYHRQHHQWGLSELSWLTHHLAGQLFRLGRLQFMPEAFKGKIRVYRNRRDRSVIALAGANQHFRGDGCISGTNGIFDEEHGWTSQFAKKDGWITGNRISPDGRAIRETVQLPEAEWNTTLAEGDPILEIHIPEDGNMPPKLCGESMQMAVQFFSRYFSGTRFRAFFCSSWLMDAQLPFLLPAASNIVQFQKEFYLYPILSRDTSTLKRIFGKPTVDLSNAPRDTTLQRAILDYMASGGRMCSGAGFILTEDLNWGRRVYTQA